MTYSIAIIGRREEIMGFAAVGLQIFPIQDAAEARDTLFDLKARLTSDDAEAERFAVIFVMEEFLREIAQEDYDKLAADALPAIIALPGNTGSSGSGNEKIRRIVEKAVGSDIFGN